MYFSMKTEPSPKAEVASEIALSICDFSSEASRTMRIPLPPPPADALINTGNPVFWQISRASSRLVTAWSVPGTMGMS